MISLLCTQAIGNIVNGYTRFLHLNPADSTSLGQDSLCFPSPIHGITIPQPTLILSHRKCLSSCT